LDKNAFYVSKLALFNVHLLDDFENVCSVKPDIEEIIICRSKKDNIRLPINLLHQATFLQFAYICLVWLWEQNKTEYKIVSGAVEKRFQFDKTCKVSGPRELCSTEDYLRLMRNAISHAKVEVEGDYFYFSDINKRDKETKNTIIRLTWEQVGQLSESVLFAINDKIYKNADALV
jgi:hypothetical protein